MSRPNERHPAILAVFLLSCLVTPAVHATTLYLNGTEYCGVAKDSAALLSKQGTGLKLSYISQNCHVEPGGLPRKNMEEELSAAAARCEEWVGEERWEKFEERWKQAFRRFGGAPDADEDPLVGAFCQAIARSKSKGALTFVNFSHGLPSKHVTSLDGKHGEFTLANGTTYGGEALWALLALVPESQRIVGLHENCYGEAIMSGMMLGPKQDFAAYRPGTCSVAGAAHDELLAMEVTRRRIYKHVPGSDLCIEHTTEIGPRETFARNVSRMKAPTLQNYESRLWRDARIYKEEARDKTSNLPVSSSSSLLTLFLDRHGRDDEADAVDLKGCAFGGRTGLEAVTSAAMASVFHEKASDVKTRLSRLYRQVFGRKIGQKVSVLEIERKLSEMESESPPGPLNKAYSALNTLRAEMDRRQADKDLLCKSALQAPACEDPEKTCTLGDLRKTCLQARSQLQSELLKGACDSLGAFFKRPNGTKLKKLLANSPCRSQEPRCLSEAALTKQLHARARDFQRASQKTARVRTLLRLAKQAMAMDLMITQLGSRDTLRATDADAALKAYVGMVDCERKRMFE